MTLGQITSSVEKQELIQLETTLTNVFLSSTLHVPTSIKE